MSLAGTRVGPYEIVSLLGRGGMGEVYRARDSRLQRDVALKLLPATVADDPDRLARFAREAQLLATLNHPHIAAIYGLEEASGGAALVLELVDGPTLADRIAAGPLPLDEAIAIARQIAEALEAAHEQGIVHRDLKPANVKLRPDGAVKVLDFGLAKATSPSGTPDLTASPTFTGHGTAAGLILGTAAYMAPEQARGRTVDKRADIWAFGVVLFEMLTGMRPFGGETVSDTLAAIIKDPPSWSSLPAGVPDSMRGLIKRLLEKDPRRRLRDIGDARLLLEDLDDGTPGLTTAPAAPATPAWRRALPWAVAAVATVVAGALAAMTFTRSESEPRVIRYTLPIGGESLERATLPTISPDGRHVAFIRGGLLWIQPLDQLEPRQLAGTAGAQFPFWSPDSREVAYLTTDALWRVGIEGTRPVRIATYRFSKGGRTPGGVWRPDGTIVFAPAATGSSLFAVTAQGGEFTEFYARDPKVESDFHRPALLPDGRTLVLAVDHPDKGADTISLLRDGRRKDILTVPGEVVDSPTYSPSGHILYHRETTTPGVWAVPFSLDRLEATGAPFLVAALGSYPSMAANGTLIYADNSVSGVARLAWLDIATGQVAPASDELFPAIGYPRLSPDGTRVAAVVMTPGQGQMVVVVDPHRRTHVRIGDRADNYSRPAWRDNGTIVYSRNVGTSHELVLRSADGFGRETVLGPGMQPQVGAGTLVFSITGPGTGGDLHHLRLLAARPPTAERLQQLDIHEWEPALSPDGKLLAYTSGDAGQSEVVVRTYPQATQQWQVSSTGGSLAVWSRAGDAIYYRDSPGNILRVAVRTTPVVSLGAPELVKRPSSLIARVGYDVSADGRRLLMVEEVRSDEQRQASLAVVHNWLATLRK